MPIAKKSLGMCLAFIVTAVSAVAPVTARAVEGALFLHGGKVFYLQPDSSIAILSREDGALLERVPGNGFHYGARFRLLGGTIVLSGNSSLLFFDAETGVRRGAFDGVDYHVVGGRIFTATAADMLAAIDVDAAKVVWEEKLDGYLQDVGGSGMRVFIRFSTDEEEILRCHDAETGEVMWEARQEEGKKWWRMLCADERVYMVTGSSDLEDPRPEAILAWTAGGESLPPLPVGGEMAAMDWYTLMESSVTVDGHLFAGDERYDYSGGKSELTPEEDARLNLPEPHAMTLGYPVSDGGILVSVWREEEDGERRPFLFNGPEALAFIDPEKKWSGRPAYWRELLFNGLDAAVADGDFVIMASRGGQVECVDRDTGESRWMYVTRGWDMDQPNRFLFAAMIPLNREFYTHRLRRLADIRGGKVEGLRLDGATAPSRPFVTVDPEWRPEEANEGTARIIGIAMIIVLFLILLSFVNLSTSILIPDWQPGGIWRLLFLRFEDPSSNAALYGVAVPFCVFWYAFMGRYSPELGATLLCAIVGAFVVSLIFAIVGFLRTGLDTGVVVAFLFWGAATIMAAGIYAVYCRNALPFLNVLGLVSTFL